jgi:hypothetical protein
VRDLSPCSGRTGRALFRHKPKYRGHYSLAADIPVREKRREEKRREEKRREEKRSEETRRFLVFISVRG